jgi:hypothetical protein
LGVDLLHGVVCLVLSCMLGVLFKTLLVMHNA